MVDYLIRCSACRDFIRFQNRNKFLMVMRVRYVHMKGLAAVINVNAGDIWRLWSATVHDNRSKGTRGNALIETIWHSLTTRTVAERSVSLNTIGDRHGIVQDVAMEWGLSSILSLRWDIWRRDIGDVHFSDKGWNDAWAVLRLLAAALLADGALVGGAVVP